MPGALDGASLEVTLAEWTSGMRTNISKGVEIVSYVRYRNEVLKNDFHLALEDLRYFGDLEEIGRDRCGILGGLVRLSDIAQPFAGVFSELVGEPFRQAFIGQSGPVDNIGQTRPLYREIAGYLIGGQFPLFN